MHTFEMKEVAHGVNKEQILICINETPEGLTEVVMDKVTMLPNNDEKTTKLWWVVNKPKQDVINHVRRALAFGTLHELITEQVRVMGGVYVPTNHGDCMD